MLNSCCKGPLVMLNYKSDFFCRAPFLPPHSHFGISAYYNKVLGFSFCELALPVASPYIYMPPSAIAGDRVEPRMLHAGPWVWVHNSRLGAFLCRWNLDHTSHRKASNPPGTNWIQVDSARASHRYPRCHPCRIRPPRE